MSLVTEEYVDFKNMVNCMLIPYYGFKGIMHTNSSVQRSGCMYKMTLGATFALYYMRYIYF